MTKEAANAASHQPVHVVIRVTDASTSSVFWYAVYVSLSCIVFAAAVCTNGTSRPRNL